MKLTSGCLAVAVAASVLIPTGAAVAADPVQPATRAGDWIAGEVTAGLAAGDYLYYPGQLIDAGLALQETGHGAEATGAGEALAPMLVTTAPFQYGYVTSTEYDEAGENVEQVGRYANATAKAAAFTQRIGQDAATQYDDVDLVAQLEDLTDATGTIADDSSYGNYANAIGQSFAVEALAQAGSDEAADATDALLAQQCPAGYFLFTLGATDCSEVPSADTTALAVISLVESEIGSTEVKAAVALATQWLESVQRPDGSFEGDASAPGANTNTTGLAGTALGKAGRTALATRAAAWIRSLQAADPGACATQAPTGAIAYNAADLASGRANGLGAKRSTWRIASYQAAPALNWAPAGGTLGISAPASAAASSKVAVVVRGLAAGEHGCVSLGSTHRLVTGNGSDLTVSFDLPATVPATHTFSVTTLSGTQAATTSVAAATPAPVKPVTGDLRASKVEKVKNNSFALTIACPSTQECAGTLKVRTVGKVELSNGKRRTLVLAKSAYSVDAGDRVTVELTLTKPARKVLGSKRLRVVAEQTTRGAEPSTTKFWLRRK